MANDNYDDPPTLGQQSDAFNLQAGATSVLKQTFSSLRHHNYRLFFTGQIVSMTGTWIQGPAMSWIVWQITGNSSKLGLIMALGSLPTIFLSIFGGLVAERFERRRVLMVTQSLLMIPPLVLAALLIFDPHFQRIQYSTLVAVALASGTIMAFDIPARQAFVHDMVGRRDLANAIALNSMVFNTSRVIGPMIGTALLNVHAALCFAANGLSYLSLLLSLVRMRKPICDDPGPGAAATATAGDCRPPPARSHDPLGGFRYVWRDTRLRTTMLLLLVGSIFGWSFLTLLPVFTTETFAQESTVYGSFLSAFGAGALTGALAMAYFGRYKNRQRPILMGVFLFCVAVMVFTQMRDYRLAWIPLYFAGMGLLACMAGMNTYVQLLVDESHRGRVMGVYSLTFVGMMAVGSLLAGSMTHYLSQPMPPATQSAEAALSGAALGRHPAMPGAVSAPVAAVVAGAQARAFLMVESRHISGAALTVLINASIFLLTGLGVAGYWRHMNRHRPPPREPG